MKIAAIRGIPLEFKNHLILVTIHPSYLLRLRAQIGFEREQAMFLKELAKVAEFERAAET
ncbi:hypothetical protein [Brucella pecoris]|uniref:Uracil-DNA glycosylase n=1 Tax=Brucella pecoris TaxID=867683 RepID=A0AB34YZX7_9HYPH|nr:uracil-DNA glycosylase [Brucella pecoris]